MGELIDAIVNWRTGLIVLLVFGFAPGALLRLIALAFHRDDPRRRELQAELYGVPWVERPLWVVQQLEVALFEGIGERLAGMVTRRRHSKSLIHRGTFLNTPDTQITFFDVSTLRSVEVPLKDVARTKYERTTSAGKPQTRHALRGKFEGRNLTKFIGQADFEAFDIPII